MCTDKIEGILSWPPPKNVKQLQKFIRFCNFYRKFIPKFSETAHPLTQLTGKTPWKWSETQDNAFSTLKKSFHPQQAQVLLLPNPNEQFFLETDASNVATGAVLYQLNEKNQHQPCGFISQTLDNTQQRYEIFDRELLAIIRALRAWRHYLIYNPKPTVIWTDHKNLIHYRTLRRLTPRQV